ncbi:MAG: SDR family NAD(P)-dependent oxidoreductase [Arenicellales bacterium]
MTKNIIITGCPSGIGACLAAGLKSRGYRVIASCRDQQDVDRPKDQGPETIHIDLADSASVESAFEYIAENCNRGGYSAW